MKCMSISLLLAILAFFLLASPGFAQYNIYANDGTFLGNTASSSDPNAINNPYGQYGSPLEPQSMNNPYGPYGSTYSSVSPNDPYAAPGQAVPVYGGTPEPYGGNASNQTTIDY